MVGYEGLGSAQILSKIRAEKLSYVVIDPEKLGSAEIEQVNVPVFLKRSAEAIAEAMPEAGDFGITAEQAAEAKRSLGALQQGLGALDRVLRKAMGGRPLDHKADMKALDEGVSHLEMLRLYAMHQVTNSAMHESARKLAVAQDYPEARDRELYEQDVQTEMQAANAQANELTVVKELVAAYAAALRTEQNKPRERSA